MNGLLLSVRTDTLGIYKFVFHSTARIQKSKRHPMPSLRVTVMLSTAVALINDFQKNIYIYNKIAEHENVNSNGICRMIFAVCAIGKLKKKNSKTNFQFYCKKLQVNVTGKPSKVHVNCGGGFAVATHLSETVGPG